VVVINAERVRLTGNKIDQKIYRHHSGYPGGLKEIPIRTLMQRRPEEVIREAVLGMLPKNKLRARRAKKLRVYAGKEALARHAGQKPQPLAL
jgi:large subunit ribosomal protein L13